MIGPNQPYALCPRCQFINIGVQERCLKCGTHLPEKSLPLLKSIPKVVSPPAVQEQVTQFAQPPAEVQATIASARQMVLVVLNGALSGQQIPLGTLTTLGSLPENTIVLSDNLVSRRHAEIKQSNQAYTFTDLNSTNGSYINGERYQTPVLLSPGMVLTVGVTQLRVEIG